MTRKLKPWVALVVTAVAVVVMAVDTHAAFTPVLDCSESPETPLFDTTALVCAACPLDGQVVAADAAECVCSAGLLAQYAADTGKLESCEECPAGSSASQDASLCLPCGGNSTYDASLKQCVCAANEALVERDDSSNFLASKICVPCADNAYVSPSDPYGCVVCPDEHQTRSAETGECTCTGDWTDAPDGQTCLPTDAYTDIANRYPLATAQQVTFRDIEDVDENPQASITVNSYLLAEAFPTVATECVLQEDAAACQYLGNLCVLQMYDEDSSVCQLFDETANLRPGDVNNVDEWKTGMPWLEYQSAIEALLSSEIASRFTFSEDEESKGFVYTMPYVLAKFTINGTFVGLEDLTTQLQLCTDSLRQQTRFLRFGTNDDMSCVLNLEPLMNGPVPYLYDFYMYDGTDTLAPLPVRIQNIRRNGQKPNAGGTNVDDVLVRRFFLYDNILGRTARDAVPEVVRVAEQVTLTVTLQDGNPGYIKPPVLDIRYTERLSSAIGDVAFDDAFTKAEGRPVVHFTSIYTMDLSDFWSNVVIFFIIMIIIVLVVWLIRVYGWLRRNRSDVGGEFLLPMVAYLLSVAGWFFFWFVFAICLYWFIFFKWQATVDVLLPTSEDHEPLEAMLWVTLLCHMVNVAYIVWKQTGVDMFLVDWERPRGTVVPKDGDIRNAKPASISIWRTFFMANEWHELQTLRKVNLEFTLFALLFLLRGVNLEYLATPQPAFTDTEPEDTDVILRFALTTSLWFITAGLQWLFHWLILDRFLDNAVVDFVDLLSLSNISLLVLHEKFSGYYLHGRSIYQYTDVSMREMGANLQEEASGMVPSRGLEENDDCQVFEVYMTPEFREQFDACYGEAINRNRIRRNNRATAAGTAQLGDATAADPRRTRYGPSDASLKAYHDVNRFLASFIDRVGGESALGYSIEEKLLVNRLLNLPPDTNTTKSSFFKTGLTSFSAVTFYGHEMSLLLLNIMVYSITDLSGKNTFISILVTYLVDRFVVWCRNHFGAKNLTRKTLVDERFLI